MLPAKQEAHELGWRRGLDLGAKPVDRVAVDPREQRPVAPLELPRAWSEPAAQNQPLRFEREQRLVDGVDRHGEGLTQ